MKMITLKRIFTFFIFGSLFSINAVAQSVYGTHPASCEAVNPSALHKVKIDDFGLFNDSPPASVWVICPVSLEFFDSSQQDSMFATVIGNANSSSVTIPCILKGFDGSSGRSIQQSQKVTIRPGDTGSYEWEVENTSLLSPTLTCKLLPGTVIGSILHTTRQF